MLKNIILFISLIFVKEAFAFRNIELQNNGHEGVFTGRYTVNYCADYKCLNKVMPDYNEKIEETKTELVLKKSARLIKDQYKKRNHTIDTFDMTSNIQLDEVIELLEEDFSGASGDAPLNYFSVKKIIGMLSHYEAMISIVGILSSNKNLNEGAEFIIIYLPQVDKVYTLKRLQFLE